MIMVGFSQALDLVRPKIVIPNLSEAFFGFESYYTVVKLSYYGETIMGNH